ncbi:hypothetical protein BRADI_1g46212v3 [Brachypodium distachyon]|uniref:SWIM-type domain-containing protein n=1 Tax=Brachypodium distachyon TaxID=15368 RepID=A0A0Q3K3R1_BRADI|nr:hypothetical protein BRADI_1g46212v3 [Brachypodium distachyon]
MLDLNEISCDLDDGFGECVEPSYCTPAILVAVHEEVGESPVTIRIAENEPLVGAPIAGDSTAVADDTNVVAEDTTGVACDAPDNIEQEIECSSQPQEPFLGMRFDTLAGAKVHYNAYPREGGEKRRRESIKQTGCKAKMTVKLIDGRWEVIFFVTEHNHELITKPSLIKYLLSHKNISPEEEAFLRILDDCNLETGQMMALMSTFYANGFIVPYTTKTISNFRSKIRSERKGDDMAETVSYFMAKQKEAPSFYFNVKLDEDERDMGACYFRDCFFPFLQSTQRSEGFNAVLKRYVNPHNSILNFVKQYEKIQVKILKQAFATYTRDIYVKFRDEFMLTGRYNVRPQQNDLYRLEPNMTYCQFYGSRSYLVLTRVGNEEYSCECGKMKRDGLLCCHILKVFTHIGIDEIPGRYIMRRWTQNAVPREQIRMANLSVKYGELARIGCCSDAANAIAEKYIRVTKTEINHLNLTRRKDAKRRRETTARKASARSASSAPVTTQATTAPAPATAPRPAATSGGAPATTTPTPATATASMVSGAVTVPAPATATRRAATFGCAPATASRRPATTTAGPAIAAASAASGAATASASINPNCVRNPDRCPTKGRPRVKRYETALELHPKKKNKCALCSSDEHNSARCPRKLA